MSPPSVMGLRAMAYLDKPSEMPGLSQSHSLGSQLVPSSLCQACDRILSIQRGRAIPYSSIVGPPCYPGSDPLPTCWSYQARLVVVGQSTDLGCYWYWWAVRVRHGRPGECVRVSGRPSRNACDDTLSTIGNGPKNQ